MTLGSYFAYLLSFDWPRNYKGAQHICEFYSEVMVNLRVGWN